MRDEDLPLHHPKHGGTLVYYEDLEVGTKFYVRNGHWDGEIVMEDGVKKVNTYDRTFPVRENGVPAFAWISTLIKQDKEDKDKEIVFDTGLLSQCYAKTVECYYRKEFRLKHGVHKGKCIYICGEGCSKEDNDCPIHDSEA